MNSLPSHQALTAPFDPAELFRSQGVESDSAVTSLDGERFNFIWLRGGYSRRSYARGLSRLPRFCGQTDRVYTVAEHCLWVANWLEKIALNQGADRAVANRLALAGLVHDAHEALTGDMPSPLKHVPLLYEYRKQEYRIDLAVFKSLGLEELRRQMTELEWDLVHVADRLAYLVEHRDLRAGRNDPRMPQDKIVPIEDGPVIEQLWLDALNERSPL